jgi:DNA-binding CsgD family transcriptional regulator
MTSPDPNKREAIKILHAQGLPTRDIASITGYHISTVRRIMYQNGLKCNELVRYQIARQRIEQVKQIAAEGLSVSQIAGRMHMNVSHIRALLYKLKIAVCPVCRLHPKEKHRCVTCGKMRTNLQLHRDKQRKSSHESCCRSLTSTDRYRAYPEIKAQQDIRTNNWRRAHPEKASQITKDCNLRAQLAVYKFYGNECQYEKFGLDGECKTNTSLQLAHLNGDGHEHRAAIGSNIGSGRMYLWVAKMLETGSRADRTGKVWTPEMFSVMCSRHHRQYDNKHKQETQEND